jgi:dTDP-4-dehydrorhamnose 3,5-epimerase
MNFTPTAEIPDVLIIEPKILTDSRGIFYESYNRELFEKHHIQVPFVQDNQSVSSKGTLRGLHYQAVPKAQAKLVRVIRGSIWDVAVDMRKGSKTFGRFAAAELSAENRKMMFIPTGFAHGFVALEDDTEVLYKVSDFYAPGLERGVRWNDPELGIKWPNMKFKLSQKDENNPTFAEAVAAGGIS